ncbi:MAG: adenylate kinase [Fimbriimonadales bacterium]
MKARRILIYGVTGSGKTHLAERLSERTGIPWHSVDDLTWMPNWNEVPLDRQREIIGSICNRDEWILDTAYGKWVETPLERLELIVALDYPRSFSLRRLLRRTIARARDGMPICNGNRETWRQAFSRNSIILWHFKSFARKRARIRKWINEGRAVIHFRTAAETEEWLSSV